MRALSRVVLCVLVCFFYCGSSHAESPATTLTFDTSLFVENDVEIKSRLTGVVDEILVDRGAEVKRGTPLLRLENKDLYLEMERARAVKAEAQSQFDRAKSLYDQQLLSASEYDQKRLAFERASAESDLAQVNYEKSTLYAPFSGIVAERYVRLGQRVVEDDNVALFRITAMAPLLARIFVPESQLGLLSVDLKGSFAPALSPEKKIPARIKWISPVVDAASGTAPVILELLEGGGRRAMKPGISGKIILSVP